VLQSGKSHVMIVNLTVHSVERREWIGRKGPSSGLRINCTDDEGTLSQFVQINLPEDAKVERGDKIRFRVREIRQWGTGSIVFLGDQANGVA